MPDIENLPRVQKTNDDLFICKMTDYKRIFTTVKTNSI